MMTWWTPQLHALLGGLVIAMGIFVMWEQAALLDGIDRRCRHRLSPVEGRSIGTVWAWTTLGLGLESMTWPIVTMVQLRISGSQPTEEQMETIPERCHLRTVHIGVLVTFAFGLFKRLRNSRRLLSGDSIHPIRKKNKRVRS